MMSINCSSWLSSRFPVATWDIYGHQGLWPSTWGYIYIYIYILLIQRSQIQHSNSENSCFTLLNWLERQNTCKYTNPSHSPEQGGATAKRRTKVDSDHRYDKNWLIIWIESFTFFLLKLRNKQLIYRMGRIYLVDKHYKNV
jgi:hypothetical protein